MADIRVEINGGSYRLGCDDGQEARVLALGRFVDSYARPLAKKMNGATDSRLLLMTALVLADELLEAREAAGTTREPGSAAEGVAALADRETSEASGVALSDPEPPSAEGPSPSHGGYASAGDAFAAQAAEFLSRAAARIDAVADKLTVDAEVAAKALGENSSAASMKDGGDHGDGGGQGGAEGGQAPSDAVSGG